MTTEAPHAAAAASSSRHHTRKNAHFLRSSKGSRSERWATTSFRSMVMSDGRCVAQRISPRVSLTSGTNSARSAICASPGCWQTAKISIHTNCASSNTCESCATRSWNLAPHVCDPKAAASPTLSPPAISGSSTKRQRRPSVRGLTILSTTSAVVHSTSETSLRANSFSQPMRTALTMPAGFIDTRPEVGSFSLPRRQSSRNVLLRCQLCCRTPRCTSPVLLQMTRNLTEEPHGG